MSSSHESKAGPSIAQQVDESAAALRKLAGKAAEQAPVIGVVLGSGLGAFGDTLEGLVKVPYGELPHLPTSKVVGHAGNFCLGTVGGVPVVCMQGRVHLYEGHPSSATVHGARTMARLGVRAVLLTNAAGGLEPEWKAGDLMAVTDHLNLTGSTPLHGPNEEALGTRFPDMSHAYDPAIRARLVDVADKAGIELRRGVYAGLLGPQYETPAEVRMLRVLGASAVGMSTVHEVIALRHMGVSVGALSCITNLAAGISPVPLDHAEVEATAKAKKDELLTLLRGWIVGVGSA